MRCITKEINVPVWKDSADEFFFSPDPKHPLLYFNVETNCGGTPLMHYNLVPKKGVAWKAIFYKVAENSSNPHYITWSVIENDQSDFHKPEFFGKLIFE